MKKVSKTDFEVKTAVRRKGDPDVLIADNNKIMSKMDWKPEHNDLGVICKTALNWEKKSNKI